MDEIKIGGRTFPFRFSLYAIEAYCELKGVTFYEFTQKASGIIAGNDIEAVIDILYSGLKGGAHRLNAEFKLTRKDVSDMIDDAGISSLPEIIRLFAESMTDKKKEGSKKTAAK